MPKFPKMGNTQEDSSEITHEKKEDSTLIEKSKRSREDIKKVFTENYIAETGLDPNDEKVQALIDKLVDREEASSKRLSKALRQKIQYRDGKKKEDVDTPKKDEIQNQETDKPLAALQSTLLKKSLSSMLPKFVERAKEEGLSKEEIHSKLKENFKSTDDDVTKEDFDKRLENAFRVSFPSIIEEEMKTKARKEYAQDDDHRSEELTRKKPKTSSDKSRPLRKFFSQKTNPSDWYKAKK